MTASTPNRSHGRIAIRALVSHVTRQSLRLASVIALFGCGGNPESAYPVYAGGPASGSSSGANQSSSAAAGAGGSAGGGSAGGAGAGIDSGGSPLEAGSAGGSPGNGATGARCKTDFAWSDIRRVDSIPSEKFARFGAVTIDELTVAWTAISGDVFVADRAAVTAPFGAPVQVNGPGALAVDRVALAPSGTSLVAVRADRRGFVGYERSTPADPWTPSPGLEFTQVRAVFEGGAKVSEPVLGADKRSFYFVLSTANRLPLVYESRWDGGQGSWGLPSNVTGTELQNADAMHLRRPTGMSTDGRTLFFFDERTNLERAAWRESPAAPFSVFQDVGPFPEAAPNLRCDSLYYQGRDAAGPGVFVAE
jgi:hypothetical protein